MSSKNVNSYIFRNWEREKMNTIYKFLIVCVLTSVTLQSSFLPALAKNEIYNYYIVTESGNIVEVFESVVYGFEQIRFVDKEGNYLEFSMNNDYFQYNGEVVSFQAQNEVVDYSTNILMRNVSLRNMTQNYMTVNYVKVQTVTTKYTLSKAISQFSADLFGLFLNWKLGLAIAIYNFIINAYSTPSLQLSKIMYIRNDKYAYLPILSQFYNHSYALDVNYVKIRNTDNFDNAGLKAFLGY